MVEIKNGRDISKMTLNLAVFGATGTTKTRQVLTLPNCLLISLEKGTLSLMGEDFDYVECSSLEDIRDVYSMLIGEWAGRYEWICLDSMSELSDIILEEELEKTSHAMQAYGAMQTKIMKTLKSFMNLDVNLYAIAKEAPIEKSTGDVIKGMMFAGTKLSHKVPYLFDDVIAASKIIDGDGKERLCFTCHGTTNYDCKNRSGALNLFEEPNLFKIANKIIEHKKSVAKASAKAVSQGSEMAKQLKKKKA